MQLSGSWKISCFTKTKLGMLLCGFMGIDSILKPTSSENLGKKSVFGNLVIAA